MDSDAHNLSPSGEDEVQVQHIDDETNLIHDGYRPRMLNLMAVQVCDCISQLQLFIHIFKYHVNLNSVYYVDKEPEMCIGCLQFPADVKINKQCPTPSPQYKGPPCQQCNCRVLWCASCMARWWAARQSGPPARWLTSRATCPMCRASFCLMDVSPARVASS